METSYPPACMTDGAIRSTPDASRLVSFRPCRVTAADGLTRLTQLLNLGLLKVLPPAVAGARNGRNDLSHRAPPIPPQVPYSLTTEGRELTTILDQSNTLAYRWQDQVTKKASIATQMKETKRRAAISKIPRISIG